MKRWCLLLCFAGVVSLSGCAKSELHDAMEEMGDAYKGMRESDSMDTIEEELKHFLRALDTAIQQPVAPEDQATFDEGLDEVAELAKQLGFALESGDFPQSKKLLAELREVSKEYHDKLGVD